MTSMVRKQLVVFIVLAVSAFVVIALVYVRVPTLLGAGQIEVKARLSAAGGIYPNANVTYRGYTIGKVKEVNLVDREVELVMSIDEEHAPPANSKLEIHSVSAVGEQFADFAPPAQPSSEPIADGTEIPLHRTSIPMPTAEVLDDVDRLLKTVDHDDLSTVLDEFAVGFRDLGPELDAIIDNTNTLLASAEANYPETELLIQDMEPLLDSQIDSEDDARKWADRLTDVTKQLVNSDGDLRAALRSGKKAGVEVGNLLDQLKESTPELLDNTQVLTELGEAYNKPIEQILVVYPAFAAFYQGSLGPNTRKMINFNIKLNPNRPACYEGWVGPGAPGGPRDAFELADAPFPDDQYCKLAQDDQRLVRGSRNLPCFEPGSPPGRRAATIQQCQEGGFKATTKRGTQLEIGGPLNDAPLFGDDQLLEHLFGSSGSKGVRTPADLGGLLLGG